MKCPSQTLVFVIIVYDYGVVMVVGTVMVMVVGTVMVMVMVVGTVGLEPTISSARGWQSTKLTYVPEQILACCNMNHFDSDRSLCLICKTDIFCKVCVGFLLLLPLCIWRHLLFNFSKLYVYILLLCSEFKDSFLYKN